MFNELIRFSIANRLLVVVAALVLLLGGSYVALHMPVDVFPDLNAPTVTILTDATGMTPTEVETLVSFPIEAAMNGATGVRRVRSSSALGFSIVWVEFDWSTPVMTARQTVMEKLSLVQATLPEQADRPVLAPQSSIMGEVMLIGLVSDRHTPFELRSQADTNLRRRLLGVEGVAQVTPLGGEKKEYQVLLDPQRLYAYQISPSEVAAALESSNANVSGGILHEGADELVIEGRGRIRSLDEIRQIVVAVRNQTPIRVAELGTVRIGAALRRGVGSANGHPAVIMAITKQPDVNTLELTERLYTTLDEIGGSLPAGMEIERNMFQQSDFIRNSINNLLRALRDGAILVVVIVVLFLGNVRASAITLTAIPLSLITAVLALKGWGTTLNTMTLGGMAIAIGELVDDAIVDVENVVRRLRENIRQPAELRRPAFQVVLDASVEIRSSIVFATLIVILVFVPLFFLPGLEGRLLAPLGMAYVVSMAASLLVAVTVTPALCYYLLPRSRSILFGNEPLLARLTKRAYAPVLARILDRPLLTGGLAAASLVVALGYLPFVGQSFLPKFNEQALAIMATTMPGTSLEKSNELGRHVEQIILAQPEIVSAARQTGRGELSEHVLGVESTEITATLDFESPDEQGNPPRRPEQFMADLRKELATVPGVVIEIGQPISHRIDHMLSGTRAAVAINVFAPESDSASLPRLRTIAEEVQQAVSGIPGVVDLKVEQQMHIPMLSVRPRRDQLARYGLHVSGVQNEIETAFAGRTVTQVLEGRNPFDLVVRVSEPDDIEVAQIERLPLATPAGTKIPLGTVAEIRRDRGPNTVTRENVQRKIVVSCNIEGRDTRSVVTDIRRVIDDQVNLNSDSRQGYYIQLGGQFEAAEQSFRLLLVLGTGSLLLIALLLYMAFASWRDSLLILLNLPMALVGGVLGLYISGGVLSIASLVGFITLWGIAARNGIMLVSHIRHLQRHEGVTDLRSAVQQGALERVTPILMTALSTGLGLLPLALAGGHPGSEIETPLAIVVVFGLLSSTVMNMAVIPALFLRFAQPEPPALEAVTTEPDSTALATTS